MIVHPVPKPYRVGLYLGFDVPRDIEAGHLLLLPNGLHLEILAMREERAAHFGRDERMATVKGQGQDVPPLGVVFNLKDSANGEA